MDILQILDVIFFSIIFVLGLFFGSFSNVVILRLHSEEKGILFGKSHCTSCNHSLGFFDLFPLFSWLFLRGRCRYCGKKISFQYPLVELLMALFWVFLVFMGGFNFGSLLDFSEVLKLVWFLFLGFFVLVFLVLDLRFFEVHRVLTLWVVPIVGAGSIFFGFVSLTDALLGVLVPSVFFGAQILIGKFVLKREVMGEGDLDFGVLMGLLLGWKITIVALFLSYFSGAVIGIVMKIKNGESEIPFGPYLLVSTLICLFWGQNILDWYLEISGLSYFIS